MKELDLEKQLNGVFKVKLDNSEIEIGIVAKNSNKTNYNLDFGKIRKYEKHLMYSLSGLSVDRIFFLNQMHRDQIVRVNIPTDNKTPFIADADAMITTREKFCLVIRTADCVPVIAYDTEKKCIAAIHSGWKSTALKISYKTIKKMQTEYGSEAKNIKIFLLPAISQENYQVNMEVAEKFESHYTENESGIYLNLISAIKAELLEVGIIEENIFTSNLCTVNNNQDFFSHRKGDKGRNLNYVYLKTTSG